MLQVTGAASVGMALGLGVNNDGVDVHHHRASSSDDDLDVFSSVMLMYRAQLESNEARGSLDSQPDKNWEAPSNLAGTGQSSDEGEGVISDDCAWAEEDAEGMRDRVIKAGEEETKDQVSLTLISDKANASSSSGSSGKGKSKRR